MWCGSKNGLLRHWASQLGSTALHMAARNGDVAVTHVLLEANADPVLRNKQGATALESARDNLGEIPAVLEAELREKQNP